MTLEKHGIVFRVALCGLGVLCLMLGIYYYMACRTSMPAALFFADQFLHAGHCMIRDPKNIAPSFFHGLGFCLITIAFSSLEKKAILGHTIAWCLINSAIELASHYQTTITGFSAYFDTSDLYASASGSLLSLTIVLLSHRHFLREEQRSR